MAPPDLQLWVFNRATGNTIDVFDGSNNLIESVTTNCPINGDFFDAAVARDGNIWFSVDSVGLQAYDPTTRNCTMYISLSESFATVGQATPGLGGKYLYFLADGSIWRMELLTYNTELFLAPPSASVFFGGFGFQNNKMYTSLQYFVIDTEPQILNSYNYDIANDEPLLPAITEDAWLPREGFFDHFFKFKKCPRDSTYFCGLPTVSGGQWVLSSLINGSDSWIVIDTYVPNYYGGYFLEYYTAPWGMMYATDENGGFYKYDWTAPSIPTSLYPTVIEGSTLYGTFVAFIGAPYVSIGDYSGVCLADIFFNSYSWTTKYVIEVKNSEGLYEDFYEMSDLVSSNVESRLVNLGVVCDAPTKSFRIRFEGDTNMSDNVYSLATTVDCACTSTPVTANVEANVVPILECIEKVDTNYNVHLGYENLQGSVVSIPVGDFNKFSDVSDRNQPTIFREGRTNFFPTSAFSFVVGGSSLSWFLSYYQLPIDTQNTAVYCPRTLRVQLTFFYSIIDPNNENIELVRLAMAQYLQISETRITVVGYEVTPVTKRAGLASGNNIDLEAEIKEAAPEQQEPSAAESVKQLVQTAKNETAADAIIDPSNTDPDSELLGVKALPTGVEQAGTSRAPDQNSPSDKTSGQIRSASVSLFALVGVVAILVHLNCWLK
jgi:hypothetical protein